MKVSYEIDLTTSELGTVTDDLPAVRSVGAADRDALARLMLDAYTGTIDYDGETLDDAIDEVDLWLQLAPKLDHSLGIVRNERIVAAIMVSEFDRVPHIAYVMTATDHKRTGLARFLVRVCLQQLRASGREKVRLAITRGNIASERLFASVGARSLPS